MSKAALEAKIKALYLDKAAVAENKIASDVIREIIQSKEVNQCLVISNRAMAVVYQGLVKATNNKIKIDKNSYIKYMQKNLRSMHKPFPRGKMPIQVFQNLLKRRGLHLGTTVVYFGNSFVDIKTIVHKLNEEYLKEELGSSENYNRSVFGNTVNYDHGTAGAASAMLGGTPAAMYIASRELDEDTLEGLVKFNFDGYMEEQLALGSLAEREFREYKTLGHKLITSWKNVVDERTGNLSANLALLIQPVDKGANIDASSKEGIVYRRLLQSVADVLVDIGFIDLQGSSTIKEKAANAVLVEHIAKPLKKQAGKRAKIKIDKDIAQVSGKTDIVFTTKIKGGKEKTTAKRNRQRLRDPKTGRFISKKSAAARQSPLQLITLINAKLPETVMKNMGLPALVNRSGTFARSARVETATTTDRGYTSFGFSYDTEPYGVFQMGRGVPPWATPDRDPRKIIGQSVREIAVQFMQTRFFTRSLV